MSKHVGCDTEVQGCPCAMQAAGKEQEFQDLLSKTESAKLEGGALDEACTALQELVSSICLKDKLLEQACKRMLLVTCLLFKMPKQATLLWFR